LLPHKRAPGCRSQTPAAPLGCLGDAGGYEVDSRADELFAAFQSPSDALAAAIAIQQSFGAYAWPQGVRVRLRIGLHTGEPVAEGGAYLGLDVNRAARICSAGHGGQILLSATTRELLAEGAEFKELGARTLAGLPQPERILQLLAPGLQSSFPPLRAEGAQPGLLRKILPSARRRAPTLEEEAWRARALVAKVGGPRQKPLTQLGAALFTAHRAATQADDLVSRIDRKGLARRADRQRETAVYSARARKEVLTLERRVTSVEQLLDRRKVLAELAAELPSKLDESLEERRIVSLRERVDAATAALDDALTEAAQTLDPLSFKLRRTPATEGYTVPAESTSSRSWTRSESTAGESFRAALRPAASGRRFGSRTRSQLRGGTPGGVEGDSEG